MDLFAGVIESRQFDGLSTRPTRVTFFIAPDRIRREVVSRDGTVSGVVFNRTNDTVFVYRASDEKKHFVRLTSLQYQEFQRELISTDLWDSRCIGTIFMGLKPDTYLATNSPHAVVVSGYDCDKLLVNKGAAIVTVIEAAHCRSLPVNRDLLAQVEIDLPVELKGFPLQVRRIEGLRLPRSASSDSKGKFAKLASRAAEWVSDGLKKVTEQKVEVVRVERKSADASMFELPSDYTALTDSKAFKRAFTPPESKASHSHSHWDDWD